jgi:PilZ domain-containing protein
MQPRTRRVQRIHFPQPLTGRLGATEVRLVDLSVLGARVEHALPLSSGGHSRLVFEWDGEKIAADCRIVRSRLEKGSHRSGIEFVDLPSKLREIIRRLIEMHLRRAFDEQRRAARDLILPPLDAIAGIDNGYVCLTLDGGAWLRKRTHDPGQPHEGFTVSADETDAQIELLREAYERSDAHGRKLIQIFAQLSIVDAEGNPDQGCRVVGLAQ